MAGRGRGLEAGAGLGYPILLVQHLQPRWRDLVQSSVPPSPDELAPGFRDGGDHWIIQTYVMLKRRHWNVELSETVRPTCLCVMHYDMYSRVDPFHAAFLVVVRADRPPALLADHVIVQNPRLARPRASYIPLWPQPGLIPRDSARGDRIERVGYMGNLHQLAPVYRQDRFRRALGELGVDLLLADDDWRDYSSVDVVLAVRDSHPAILLTKPASKLVNAWRAGCPALLGPEPAFHDLRRSELDYLELRSPDEALAALRRLRDEPGLFRAMAENGRRRETEYGVQAVLARWEAVLAEEIVPGYERWLHQPAMQRLMRRVRFSAMSPLQELASRRFYARASRLPPRVALYRASSRRAMTLATSMARL